MEIGPRCDIIVNVQVKDAAEVESGKAGGPGRRPKRRFMDVEEENKLVREKRSQSVR